jgi:pimeloyl-ACP methyl ester carboxylesterase
MVRPLVRATLERSFGDDDLVTDAMVDRYFETINAEGHRGTVGQRLGYLLAYDPIERLEGVTVPTLILWGEEDALRPVVYADLFRQRIRGSVLHVYPRVGHFPMEEAADATAAAVRAFMRGERADTPSTGGACDGDFDRCGRVRRPPCATSSDLRSGSHSTNW